LLCACAYGVKSEISLDTGDSASNAVVKHAVLFLLTSVVQHVCLCTMNCVSAGKNTLLLYVNVCEYTCSNRFKRTGAYKLIDLEPCTLQNQGRILFRGEMKVENV